MELHVNVSNQVIAQLRDVSQSLGMEESSLIQRAILYYLNALQEQIALTREMQAWDELSDEALANFEAAL